MRLRRAWLAARKNRLARSSSLPCRCGSINQLYWQDAPTYKALVDAAEKLRTAHRSALSGRKADTRKPDQLHRTTIEKAFAKAIGIAEKGGGAVTDSVRDTVRRTLAALPGDEPDGRLTRPPEPAGFQFAQRRKNPAGVQSPESKVQSRESKSESESKSSAREELEARKRAERERKEAERKARHEQQEREKREREIRKAEQALRDAERRLAELKG